MNDAFISIVESYTGDLTVRARKREHLTALLGKHVLIKENKTADYRYRTFISKEALANIIAQRITHINYHNFKNSVEDPRLHRLYAGFWQDHHAYQFEPDAHLHNVKTPTNLHLPIDSPANPRHSNPNVGGAASPPISIDTEAMKGKHNHE